MTNILDGRVCNSLLERDVLALGCDQKDEFIDAFGYQVLDKHIFGCTGVPR